MIKIGRRLFKGLFMGLVMGIFLCNVCNDIVAITVTDVKRSDPAYKAIKYSITNGYLPLYSKKTFKPNKEITRKELALTIDALITKINQHNISLTDTEIQELNYLSHSFKTTYTELDLKLSSLALDQKNQGVTLVQIQEEQSRSESGLTQSIKSLKQQNIVMWVAIALATFFGIR
jgi:hypothetical protein